MDWTPEEWDAWYGPWRRYREAYMDFIGNAKVHYTIPDDIGNPSCSCGAIGCQEVQNAANFWAKLEQE